MGLPRRQVIHIRLEILNDPRLIRACEVRSRAGERQSTDGAVVCLEDRLEVEREAVPQSEFARGAPRQHAPGLWCPCDAVDGTPDFVC